MSAFWPLMPILVWAALASKRGVKSWWRDFAENAFFPIVLIMPIYLAGWACGRWL